LDALIDSELDAAEEREVRTHLDSCDACARELEERRAYYASLGAELKSGLREFSASPKEKAETVARMTVVATARPRWPRVAAAAVLLVGIGWALWYGGLFGPRGIPAAEARPLVRETAERVAELEASRERYERLIREIERMTEEVRSQLPPDKDLSSADRTVALELAAVEDRMAQIAWHGQEEALPSDPKARVDKLVGSLASSRVGARAIARRSLRSLGPETLPYLESASNRVRPADRWYLRYLVERLESGDGSRGVCAEFTRPGGDRRFEFRQYGDAKVELVIMKDGRPTRVQARNMTDLMRRHSSLCQEYRIAGVDGWVSVEGNYLGKDFDGQLELAFCALEDADFAPYRREAYVRVLSSRVKNARELESKVVALEAQCRRLEERRAAAPNPDPQAVARVAANLAAWDESRLRGALASAEAELKKVAEGIDTCSKLQGRLGSLQHYLKEVRTAMK